MTPDDPPVLGRVLVRQYLELGHRVERDARLRSSPSTVGVLIGGAVHRPEIAGGRSPVHVEVPTLELTWREGRCHPRDDLHQREVVVALTGKAVDLRVGDHRTNPARRDLDDRRLARHGDGLSDRGQAQREHQVQLLANPEDEALLCLSLETSKIDADGIDAWSQRRHHELPFRTGR